MLYLCIVILTLLSSYAQIYILFMEKQNDKKKIMPVFNAMELGGEEEYPIRRLLSVRKQVVNWNVMNAQSGIRLSAHTDAAAGKVIVRKEAVGEGLR